eukprot:scaffold132295_cov10-Tisochrysis_lutea.AAC.1
MIVTTDIHSLLGTVRERLRGKRCPLARSLDSLCGRSAGRAGGEPPPSPPPPAQGFLSTQAPGA